jgi:hypothetical protein
MSKQTGLIRLKGTIGGVTFYKSEGADLARMANGPDKERIDNDPAFQRTRENNKEFGGSATAAKALRTALAASLQTVADPRLVSRLTRLFKQINTKGVGTRGQRPITVSANRPMLLNSEFNRKTVLSSIFSAPFTATFPAARNAATLTIPAFDPSIFIQAPAGATHFRVIQAIGSLSDFTYNASTGTYQPTQAALNSLGTVTYSAFTLLVSAVPVNFALTSTLPGAPVMTADVSVVHCMGIEFYQQIGGVNYVLAQGNAMKVIAVF